MHGVPHRKGCLCLRQLMLGTPEQERTLIAFRRAPGDDLPPSPAPTGAVSAGRKERETISEAEIEARWQGMLARVCSWRDGHGGWSPLSDGRELVSEGRAVRIYTVCVCTAM
jgi:hypothetical protein